MLAKRLLAAASLLALALPAASLQAVAPRAKPVPATAEVYFSPNGGVQDAIVRELDASRSTVRMLAFHFTNKTIARALVRARDRGVDVQVVVDDSNLTDGKSAAPFLLEKGVDVRVDSDHHTAHNKVILIDGRKVLTGSYNYNRNAEEKNSENMVILTSPELAAQYGENWDKHRVHSVPYPRGSRP